MGFIFTSLAMFSLDIVLSPLVRISEWHKGYHACMIQRMYDRNGVQIVSSDDEGMRQVWEGK